jgi:hypothetical protein
MQQDETLPLDESTMSNEQAPADPVVTPVEEKPHVVDMSRIFAKFDAESLLQQLRSIDVTVSNSEKIVRLVRDQLLNHTDWTQAADAPLTDTVKQNFATYRQALRDITSHPDYPDSVTFPPMPSTK